jgi:hypothetical protein
MMISSHEDFKVTDSAALNAPPTEEEVALRGSVMAGDAISQVEERPSLEDDSRHIPGNVARLNENVGEEREEQVPDEQSRVRDTVNNLFARMEPSGHSGNTPAAV